MISLCGIYIFRVDSHGLPVEDTLDGSDNSDKVRIWSFHLLSTLDHSMCSKHTILIKSG